MFSFTPSTGLALLASLSFLPACLSLPKAQVDEIPPKLASFDFDAPSLAAGFPNFPIPGTDMTFKFVDGRQDFNRAEIACLLNQGEAVVAARPAGEVIPSAGSWHRGKGPFPYAAKLEDVSFLLSNEGSNPVFTKEIGIVAIKGLREWLKTIRPRSLRFGGALIVGQGSSRPVGVLSFDSTYQGAEFTLTRLEK